MDYSIEFAEREDVRELANAFLKVSDAVQGISIDLDPLWLSFWQAYTLLPPDDVHRYDAWFRDTAHWYAGTRWWSEMHVPEVVAYPYGIDTSWRPPAWEEHMKWRGLRPEPFVIIVVLRPDVPRDSLFRLQEIETRGFQVRSEARPVATLLAGSTDKIRPVIGGVSVSSPNGKPGTLGGILEDGSAKRFGLTCAHVLGSGDDVQQPSPADNRGAALSIGQCVQSNTLSTHVAPVDAYDPSINEIDAALVELSEPADLEVLGVGPLAGVAGKSQVHRNMSVEVVGKESHEKLVVGPTSLAHEFRFDGDMYAYKNLFELRRASRFWGVTGTVSRPVKGGDSGGWVFRAGSNGTEWLGVVIAGDGPVGYAVPAEFIMDWIGSIAGHGALSVA